MKTLSTEFSICYRRIGLFWFLIVTMLLFAVPANGSKKTVDNDNDLTSRSLGELMEIEVGTVYGASRFEQKVTRAPASVTIITAEDIQRFGYRTLAEILAGAPDFFITNDRNYNYIGSRGFLRPGDYNTRYLLIVDGHRLNDSVYNQASVGTDFPVDVDLIERVEVIRGPASSLYGTNAFLGVINIITKKGRQIDGAEISGAAGSQRTYQGRVTLGSRFEEKNSEVLVSGTKYRSTGKNELFYPEFNDPATNYGIVQGCDGDSFGNAFLKSSWGYLNLEGVYLSRDKDIPTAPWGTDFGQAGTKSTDKRGYVDLSFDKTFGSDWAVLARVYYDYYRYDGDYVFSNSLNKDRATGESWGSELKLTKTLFDRHKLTVGTEYTDDYRLDQSNWNDSPRVDYLDDHRSSYQWAAYFQDEITLFSKLILNLGVRYDYYEVFGSTTNPRLALIYSPWETTHIKLIYGEAFRAPNVYELYYNDGNMTSKANPGLQPEKIATSEIILEQYLPQGFKAGGSVFHSKIKDLIVQKIDPSDGLQVFQNVDEVETTGFTLEVEKRWSNGIKGQIAYTYQESENEDGTAVVASPRNIAKAHLQVPFFRERLVFALEELYVDRLLTVKGNDAKSYYVTNLTVLGKEWLPGLETSFSVYNAFNYTVEYPASTEHTQRTIEGDGRTMRIKLTYRF